MKRCEKCRYSVEMSNGKLGCINRELVPTGPTEASVIYGDAYTGGTCPPCTRFNLGGDCVGYEEIDMVAGFIWFCATVACCYGIVKLIMWLFV